MAQLQVDANTTLLCHFEGNLLNEVDGINGSTIANVNYFPSPFGTGVLITGASDGVSFPVTPYINKDEGTVEFFVSLLNPVASFTGNKRFWEIRAPPSPTAFNGMVVRTDSVTQNIAFALQPVGKTQLSAKEIASPNTWQVNEWHHIAGGWSKSQNVIKLWLDGVPQSTAVFGDIGTVMPPIFVLGADGNYQGQTEAIYDEYRVSNVLRTDAEIAADATLPGVAPPATGMAIDPLLAGLGGLALGAGLMFALKGKL